MIRLMARHLGAFALAFWRAAGNRESNRAAVRRAAFAILAVYVLVGVLLLIGMDR